MSQILRLYHKEHEILPLPLHGDSLISGSVEHELMELRRLGAPIYYIIDSERTSAEGEVSKNRNDFVALCNRLGFTGLVLERRALENYFSTAAIRRAFPRAKFVALEPFEKLNGVNNGWSKRDNWRIAAELKRTELDDTDLGQFLDSL